MTGEARLVELREAFGQATDWATCVWDGAEPDSAASEAIDRAAASLTLAASGLVVLAQGEDVLATMTRRELRDLIVGDGFGLESG